MGWILLGIAVGLFLFFTLLIENEKWGWATLALAVTGAVYSYVNRHVALDWLGHNWVEVVLFTGGYLLAGIVWSFVKWLSFLMGFREALAKAKLDYAKYVEDTNRSRESQRVAYEASMATFKTNLALFIANGGVPGSKGEPHKPFQPELVNQLTLDFQSWADQHRWSVSYLGNSIATRPQASTNKTRIVAWMSFWPFSLVGTVVNDPVRRLLNWLYNLLSGTYQRMSDHIFRNEDMLK